MERILIPLDGSKVGEVALPYVEDLISKLTAAEKVEVTLIQVIASLTHYVIAGEASAQIPYTEQEMKEIEKRAEGYLKNTGEKLKKLGAAVKIKVAVGNAADEIIRTADEINADLVAMSTHGRSGIGRWAFGSVTDRVLRGGNHPVLMVRAPKDVGR
jgi:nucleotide-binding universal stress UspA family protein